MHLFPGQNGDGFIHHHLFGIHGPQRTEQGQGQGKLPLRIPEAGDLHGAFLQQGQGVIVRLRQIHQRQT